MNLLSAFLLCRDVFSHRFSSGRDKISGKRCTNGAADNPSLLHTMPVIPSLFVVSDPAPAISLAHEKKHTAKKSMKRRNADNVYLLFIIIFSSVEKVEHSVEILYPEFAHPVQAAGAFPGTDESLHERYLDCFRKV